MDREDSNDYELLYLIYQMDEESLQILVDKYILIITNALRNYFIKSILNCHGEELLQDAIVLLYEAIYGYRNDLDASFNTYYKSILQNKLTNFYRHMSVRYTHQVNYSLSLDTIVAERESFADLLPNKNPSLEGEYYLAQVKTAKLIRKKVKSLNENEIIIFLLWLKGYSYLEIAKELKINIKKVDNTLQKIRKQKV